MIQEPNFLYNFLPLVYRQQDQLQGMPLQALFTIMQQELENIQGQIGTAYANCFIETCETWAEAYIADLLGIQGLHNVTLLPTQRARIANTIRYRRHKGQSMVLERIISDVTGWQTYAVEYAQLLGSTQHIQHIRAEKGETMNIRDRYGVATLKTPFEVNAHRVDVRNYPTYPAKFNINNVGLFIWRLGSYPLIGGFAKEINTGRYTFNPIGLDTQLFNAFQPIINLTQPITETSLPVAIRAADFARDLAENANSTTSASAYYGNQSNENQIYITVININGKDQAILANQIVAADLSTWDTTPPSLSADQVAIDVTLGRFMLGSSYTDIDHIKVNYNYGFSASMAGGHYDRGATLTAVDKNTIHVSYMPSTAPNTFTNLQDAITQWENNPTFTTIQIDDDATYPIDNVLLIKNTSTEKRTCFIQAANNTRPCLQLSPTASIQLSGASDASTLTVTLNGLLICSLADSSSHNPQSTIIDLQDHVLLTINHCTLAPQTYVASLFCSVTEDSTVTISNSIVGALYLPENAVLTVNDSIIDGLDKMALTGPTINATTTIGPSATLERVTVLGAINAVELVLLSESIVTGTVITERTQDGIIRFSYLPMDSQTPPRYQCQPDLEFIPQAKQRAREQGLSDYTQLQLNDLVWWNNTLTTLQPQFTSTQYNNPGYAQLNVHIQQSIATGAKNSSEMGCFQSLNQPQRQAQLQALLDEYLPLGLVASLFYVD